MSSFFPGPTTLQFLSVWPSELSRSFLLHAIACAYLKSDKIAATVYLLQYSYVGSIWKQSSYHASLKMHVIQLDTQWTRHMLKELRRSVNVPIPVLIWIRLFIHHLNQAQQQCWGQVSATWGLLCFAMTHTWVLNFGHFLGLKVGFDLYADRPIHGNIQYIICY